MKELPKIHQENINKEFNNNNKFYYGNGSEERKENKKSINQKINEIFSSPKYIYKANVKIKLKDKEIDKRIIGRNKEYIITMDNDLIPIKDILDIKSFNK